MVDLGSLKKANEQRWRRSRLTRDTAPAAHRLVAAKPRYQAVHSRVGVPWPVVAVIHERESSQDWTASLAQGDPWSRVSVHVPAGRGPFKSWEDAAIDALTNCPPHAARWKDWSIGGALTLLELYNGTGYAARGLPSPYLWSGTDQYKSGKYVRDGVYDPNRVDQQLGCAALLKAMISIDPSITFADAQLGSVTPARVDPAPPSIVNPSKGSVGAFVVSFIRAIFRKR